MKIELISKQAALSLAKDVVLEGGAKHRCIDSTMLHELPTVEAIPIEWIKRYGEQNWFDYGTQHNAITCMLKAWKEEGEKNELFQIGGHILCNSRVL